MKFKQHLKALTGAMLVGGLCSTSALNASILDRPSFRVLGVVLVWGANDVLEGGGTGGWVMDFNIMDGAAGTAASDLIADNGFAVLTGTLTPISKAATTGSPLTVNNSAAGFSGTTDSNNDGFLDATDSISEFKLDGTTDVGATTAENRHSFYVASNTAFDIYAQASLASATGDFSTLNLSNISWKMGITTSGSDGGLAFGSKAQDPGTGGTGVISGAAADALDDFAAPAKVFDGGQRTAAAVGSIAEQSVRFDLAYGLNDGSGGAYDLSMGTGEIVADVTYTVYNP